MGHYHQPNLQLLIEVLPKKPCTLCGAGLFFALFFFTTVVILKSLPFICHSGLDKACPVLDAGESSVSGLDSCWSLSR
jgi:hypothetical protein